MKTASENQSDESHDGSLRGTQGIRQDSKVSGRSDERNDVALEISATLYEDLLDMFRESGCVEFPEFVARLLRDEVRRAESDNLESGYSTRELELIRRLLHNIDCSD